MEKSKLNEITSDSNYLTLKKNKNHGITLSNSVLSSNFLAILNAFNSFLPFKVKTKLMRLGITKIYNIVFPW